MPTPTVPIPKCDILYAILDNLGTIEHLIAPIAETQSDDFAEFSAVMLPHILRERAKVKFMIATLHCHDFHDYPTTK